MLRSEEYYHAIALQIALEGMLFQMIKMSGDPESVLGGFVQHMKKHERALREYGMEEMLKGDFNTHSDAYDSLTALEKVREDLIHSVTITT